MSAIIEAIQKLAADDPVGGDLAGHVAEEILEGTATEAQLGAFMTALHIRGERPEHLVAFARVMRKFAAPIPVTDPDTLVDTCGTGGDSGGTFNISTAAAIIAAGAGARVAKHGNRAITSQCGSADVLAALGVNLEMSPATAARCLNEAGITFFFAPVYHSGMRHAGPARRQIGIRSIFNMLGPLANPAAAGRQVIGVFDGRLTSVFAEVLLELGCKHAMIVHGSDGLDEITLTGPTRVTEATDGQARTFKLDPTKLGLKLVQADELLGSAHETDAAAENALLIRGILAGEPGPKRAIAEINAAAALVVADRAPSMAVGLELARESVDSGRAAKALAIFARVSQEDGSA